MEDDYTIIGSGIQLAYGHLEQAYEEGLSNEEATTIVTRRIKSAAERDTGSGNGVFLCQITNNSVDIHGHRDFDEVLQAEPLSDSRRRSATGTTNEN